MNRVDLENEYSHIVLGPREHLHIEKVEVYTGDDEYMETDSFAIESDKDNKGKLIIRNSFQGKTEASARIRFEPGVRLFLSAEDGGHFVLDIRHHNGSIITSVDKISTN